MSEGVQLFVGVLLVMLGVTGSFIVLLLARWFE